MKNVLTGIALLFITTGIHAQSKTVTDAFAKSFPGATKIKWEKEGADFEVGFTLNGQGMSAVYNGKGDLMEKEVEIKVSELPAGVAAYVKEHYKGAKITDAARITKANGEVNIEAGIKGKDILFTADGKFLKEAKD
ncbi:PepSY-like domain-containing protein [Chitinophaga niabensis]|uniref:Putative beta-lactamase-inhibitor-like, PepSY-like n=1 Tax=Chitinophaga niabensis TaxID=536979 RepID=A0A1N6JQ07_9BACT|nr:PepSY-like domain-containing protein [Chitinophaga niabensis]SIO46432.1 Putative beta-lactamase-inhibitor-like, PepSY-like [Chitinophaga niabensis]